MQKPSDADVNNLLEALSSEDESVKQKAILKFMATYNYVIVHDKLTGEITLQPAESKH